MQQLQNASESRRCARNILEAVLAVMVAMRETAARRQRREGRDGGSLIHIRAMGVLRKRPGATLSAVADQLALTLSATSRLVDGLVDRGLVKRVVPAGNRRTVSLMLTRLGQKKLEACLQESQEEVVEKLRQLDEPALRRMGASMQTLRGLFEIAEPPR